jgi:hypothetical protein
MPAADGTIGFTPGSGATVDVMIASTGEAQQYIRQVMATAITSSTWATSTTAGTSIIAADVTRVVVLMVNGATGRIYIRFDSTAPTSAAYHWYLEPNDRWEVPLCLSRSAVSFLGVTGASGNLLYMLGGDG